MTTTIVIDGSIAYHCGVGSSFDDWLVAHVQRSHELAKKQKETKSKRSNYQTQTRKQGCGYLQSGDFERKIKRSNNGNWTKWPAVAAGFLTIVVSANRKATRKKANL